MDQADREEFSIQTKANLDLAKEKDVSSTIYQQSVMTHY